MLGLNFSAPPLYVLTYTIAFGFISCLPHFVAHINKKFKKKKKSNPTLNMKSEEGCETFKVSCYVDFTAFLSIFGFETP